MEGFLCSRFAPDLKVVVYVGSKEARDATRQKMRKNKGDFTVLLTTYEVFDFTSVLLWVFFFSIVIIHGSQ